jgi:hypothetical protein
MKNQDARILHRKKAKPILRRLTRRQALGLVGGAVGVITGGLLWSPWADRKENRPSRWQMKLSPYPMRNPGFQMSSGTKQGQVLWTHKADGEMVAYRLNLNGAQVLQQCDGCHPLEQIAQEYELKTGRKRGEAASFVSQLAQVGLVVCGGHITTVGSPPHAGWLKQESKPPPPLG